MKELFGSIIWKTAALIIFLFTGCVFVSCKSKSEENYVLVVSLDGFRWDYPSIYNTPNLDQIATEGVKAKRMYSSFPTNTFPNHYSMVTGLYPGHHGLINNVFFAPDLNKFYQMNDISIRENPAFYSGEPMWVTAEKQGVKAAAFYWVGSEAPIEGIYPSYWKKYTETVEFSSRIDSVVKWFGYPESKRPKLINLYLDEPDATSHTFGPVSEQTRHAVESIDSLVGILRVKLSELPIADKINIIVVSDHGMASVSPDKYISLSKIIPKRMIEVALGGNPIVLVKPAEGKTDSLLFLINQVPGVKAWRKSELPDRWHYTHPRVPEIVVLADSSWSIGISPIPSRSRGGHGYDNLNPELHSIFYATGPAFKRNYIFEELNNVDIYGIVCKILNLKPAPNDGNPKIIVEVLK